MSAVNKIPITIQYYASLRERVGKSSEHMEISLGTNLQQLYDDLQLKYGLVHKISKFRVAANDRFVEWSYLVQAGDDIVFIPPVGGG